jgi:hypothetical protein
MEVSNANGVLSYSILILWLSPFCCCGLLLVSHEYLVSAQKCESRGVCSGIGSVGMQLQTALSCVHGHTGD